MSSETTRQRKREHDEAAAVQQTPQAQPDMQQITAEVAGLRADVQAIQRSVEAIQQHIRNSVDELLHQMQAVAATATGGTSPVAIVPLDGDEGVELGDDEVEEDEALGRIMKSRRVIVSEPLPLILGVPSND